ncbi:hypothetical protein B0T12DRAFT_422814 [Alternaria alternata]|nr:hypothetical protein B0T12DRAFT_422814 [Alternaria alternata]
MRLRGGTLIASVGSVTICAWSFVRALTLPMVALTLSAATSTTSATVQQLASRTSPATPSPRSPRHKLSQWLWPLSCSELSGR